MSKKVIGIIPARFGSSRFPGKLLADISGKSLIQHTYENAQRCRVLEDLVVATDDQRIFQHVLAFGGNVVMTSIECPTGTERITEALKKNGEFNDVGIVVNIQGDEPFLEGETIERVVEILQKSPDCVTSTAVAVIKSEEEAANFSVVKCVLDLDGHALYFSRTLIPNGHKGKWNSKITYYRHLGIYAYRREFLLHYADLAPTPLELAEDLEQLRVLEHGFKIKAAVVESKSSGIDVPEDIRNIETLL